jgi:hypothetical protein
MTTVTGYPAAQPSSGSDAQRLARAETHAAEWRIGSLEAPLRRPGAFVAAAACPCCMSFELRRRALHGDMTRYVCCGVRAGASACGALRSVHTRAARSFLLGAVSLADARAAPAPRRAQGAYPCSGKCGEAAMPEACLAAETFCCFGPSVAVTRFMIQDEMGVRNSPTDNCLVGTQFALAQLACICSCAAWLSGNDAIACALRARGVFLHGVRV